MKTLKLLISIFALLVSATANADVLTGDCGKDGDNLKYTLDTESGVLKIEGSGEMADYDDATTRPWNTYCDNILTIELPDSLTSIGSSAFYKCAKVRTIDIPNSVAIIDDRAFQYCSGLTSITLPDSLQTIGMGAFACCTGITGVLTIPSSVTSIEDAAFTDCNGVTTLNYNAIYADVSSDLYNATLPQTITALNIGNGVLIVPNYIAYNCLGLTSVTIPSSVKEIKYRAFYGCSNITTMTCEAIAPPATIFNPFPKEYRENGTVYVPAKSLEYYKIATFWRDIKNIEAIPGSDVPEEKDTVYVEVHDTVYVDKIIEKEVIKEVTVEVHDTTYVDKIIEVEVPVEKLVEVHDTIYVYDDTRSEIVLPSGGTMTLYIRDGIVYIENAPLGELITSYTIDGEMYEATRVKDTITTLTLPRGAIYVIKVGEKTFKIKI